MYQICKTATAAKKMQNDCHPHLENSETLAKFPDSEILGQCNTLGGLSVGKNYSLIELTNSNTSFFTLASDWSIVGSLETYWMKCVKC